MEVVRGVTCTPGFLLLGAALVLLDGEGVLPWALMAAAVHELGHYAAVQLQGGAVKELRLTISGGEMTLDRRRPLTYAGELAAILAGPGVSLVLAWAALRLGEEGWLLAGLSLCLGGFNPWTGGEPCCSSCPGSCLTMRRRPGCGPAPWPWGSGCWQGASACWPGGAESLWPSWGAGSSCAS